MEDFLKAKNHGKGTAKIFQSSMSKNDPGYNHGIFRWHKTPKSPRLTGQKDAKTTGS